VNFVQLPWRALTRYMFFDSWDDLFSFMQEGLEIIPEPPWPSFRFGIAGFKLGLRISRLGMITHYPLLAARSHDIQSLDTLLEGFEGIAPADKGFIDEYRQSRLLEQHGIRVVTSVRKNMQDSNLLEYLLRFCKRIRKFVETVGSHLTERFGIDQIRVHDLWHFQHRLIRKILAHTVCVFLNLIFHRPPLDLDGLVSI
jgi:hypothetical protein